MTIGAGSHIHPRCHSLLRRSKGSIRKSGTYRPFLIEKLPDFAGPHVTRMAFIVEEHVLPAPLDTAIAGVEPMAFFLKVAAKLIKQLGDCRSLGVVVDSGPVAPVRDAEIVSSR